MQFRRRGSGGRRRGPVPGFEPLEGRIVLDAAATRGLAAAVTLVDGTLTVNGTVRPDRITIGVGRRGRTLVDLNGEQALFSGVGRIDVRGNRGADRIRIEPQVRVPTTVDGGLGPDRVVATGSSADVSGGAGDDVLIGGGGGRPTLDGDAGAGRVVFDGPLGTLRFAAGAGGEALSLLRQGYRLTPLRAGAAGAAASGAGATPMPILVGPSDLSVPTKVDALRSAYAAGETVAITDATAEQAQQLATLVGHSGSVRLRDGQPVAAMVAFRRVSRGGNATQYETTVTYPSQAPAGPRARAAGRHQLEALTAVFAARPSVAAPAGSDAPGSLLALANSYVYRSSITGRTYDFVQNVTTVYGVRSFDNQSDFYYVSQETDLVASSVEDQTNSANVYMKFEQSPRAPGLLETEPADTIASRSVTSGVSYTIGGSIGYNQAQGFNASITGGVTISNSTTTSYPPINIKNLSNNAIFGIGNPAWNFAVDPPSAKRTEGTTVTAVDNYIWQVPFSLYQPDQTQIIFSVQVDYDTSDDGVSTSLALDPVVDIPLGNTPSIQSPVITAVDRPTVSPGQVFTIEGQGFYPSLVTKVEVGGIPATFQALSDTKIAVVASPQPGINQPVVVLTEKGVSNFNVTVNISSIPSPPPPPTPAPVATIAGNLGQSILSFDHPRNLLVGGRFTVAPGTIWALDSVTLLLDSEGQPINVPISLYADNDGTPGNLLADLGNLVAPTFFGYLPKTLTLPADYPTLPLYGGTSYWLVIDPNPSDLSWANTQAITSGPNGKIDPLNVTLDADGNVYATSDYPQQFRVKGRRLDGD